MKRMLLAMALLSQSLLAAEIVYTSVDDLAAESNCSRELRVYKEEVGETFLVLDRDGEKIKILGSMLESSQKLEDHFHIARDQYIYESNVSDKGTSYTEKKVLREQRRFSILRLDVRLPAYKVTEVETLRVQLNGDYVFVDDKATRCAYTNGDNTATIQDLLD